MDWCGPRSGRSVLDVGTGGGHVADRLARVGCAVVTCDLSPAMEPDVVCPAESLPFDDASFDVVVTRLAAHHFADVRAAVREMARVAREHVVVEDTLWLGDAVEEAYRLHDPTHVQTYSRSAWEGFLADVGLVVDRATVVSKTHVFEEWLASTGCPPERSDRIRALLGSRLENGVWTDRKLIIRGGRSARLLRQRATVTLGAAVPLAPYSPVNVDAGNAVRTSDRAYRELKERIVNGDLVPGSRLVEVQLAEQLNISRTPIREALKQLASEGFVSRDTTGTLVVHAPTSQEIDEIYHLREVLDGLAARLATHRITPDELAQLRLVLGLMNDAHESGDARGLVERNIAFHDLIHQAAGSPRLVALSRDLRDFVRRDSTTAFTSPERLTEVIAEHERILAALEAGDAEGAEQAAREHIGRARAHMAQRRLAAALGTEL